MVGAGARRIGARMDGGREGGGKGDRHSSKVRFETEIIPSMGWVVVVVAAAVGQTQLYPAQRNVFLVRSPVKRVGYARLGPDPGRPLSPSPFPPAVDENTEYRRGRLIS